MTYLPADYTKVDEAIAKANALNKDNYNDFSVVETAVNAVVRDKKITEQSEVDAMAQAIEDTIAALQYKDMFSFEGFRPMLEIIKSIVEDADRN